MAAETYPLMTLFGRTLSFLSIEFELRLKRYGMKITSGEFVLLYRLSSMQSDKITQQNFATLLGKHKSVILRQIDVLEAKNLVARMADETDKRKNIISLTKKGRETLDKVLQIEAEMMHQMTVGIDDDAIESLKQTAWKIQENALGLRAKSK